MKGISKFELITGSVMVALAMFIAVMMYRYDSAMTKVDRYQRLEKALVSENDSLRSSSIEKDLTIYQLEMLNDSVSRRINNVLSELEVHKKRLQRVEYIRVETTIHDSLVVHDTLFVPGIDLDTALTDNRWYTIDLGLHYPGTIIIDPSFEDEYIITSEARKVIAGKPSKVFFVRWFQKRQTIVESSVHNSNPWVSVEDTRFINIVK